MPLLTGSPELDEAVATTLPRISSLTWDFLTWIACDPRTYAEAMEAWRSTCPRFTIWEDALADGLIQLERGDGATMSAARVILTARGQAVLAAAGEG